MSKPASGRCYRTLIWSGYNASLRERGSLTGRYAAPSGKRGRQQTFSAAAIQARSTIEVLFGLLLG